MFDPDDPGSPRDPTIQRLWLLAHDLKNTCSVMSYAFHGLPRHLAAGHAAQEAFADVQNLLTQTSALTIGLIDALHLQAGGRAAISLHDFLTEREASLASMLGPITSLNLELSSAGGIVLAGPEELERLLVALVSNAGLSMPLGGEVTIETRWLEHAASQGRSGVWPRQYVRLTIRNMGEMLDGREQLRLLEPFRGDIPGPDAERDSIVSAVRRLHGWLIVESDRHAGTRVHVFLPAVPEPPAG